MVSLSKLDDISILHLYGEVSLLEMELMGKIFSSLHRHRHYKVLLNLAEVEHLHYRVFSQWIEAAEKFRLRNGDLKIVHGGKNASLLLKFTGADQCLADYSSLSDAILSFVDPPRSSMTTRAKPEQCMGSSYDGLTAKDLEEEETDPGTLVH